MAEERILIFNVGDQCAYRSEASVSYFAKNGDKIGARKELVCHREDNYGDKCDDELCKKCDKKHFLGISRSEAIKKMSEGIAKYKNEGGLFCDGYAEAALDALL